MEFPNGYILQKKNPTFWTRLNELQRKAWLHSYYNQGHKDTVIKLQNVRLKKEHLSLN